jgi:hypothetical protein
MPRHATPLPGMDLPSQMRRGHPLRGRRTGARWGVRGLRPRLRASAPRPIAAQRMATFLPSEMTELAFPPTLSYYHDSLSEHPRSWDGDSAMLSRGAHLTSPRHRSPVLTMRCCTICRFLQNSLRVSTKAPFNEGRGCSGHEEVFCLECSLLECDAASAVEWGALGGVARFVVSELSCHGTRYGT